MRMETRDLILSWLILSLAFGIALRDNWSDIYAKTLIAAFSVGIGFIVHELSHRRLARKYGCFAEFRANYGMLLIAVAISFSGFVFAAPGAVWIQGQVTKEQRGKISLSGPLSNIILAGIFLPLQYVFTTGFLNQIMHYGAWINAFLAVFNLLPLGMLDGAKVLAWSKKIFALTFIIGIVLMILVL